MPVETPHLIAPAELPDGSFAWAEHGGDVGEVVAQLRAYDPRLSLVCNTVAQRWEVWRKCEDEVSRRIGSREGTHVPNGHALVRSLAEHDTRRGFDPVGTTIAHNDKVDADKAARQDEAFEDKADRLAFALGRDLDEPAQDGRLYTLGAT